MKTSYSRRELYALGEMLGESSTRYEAGRRVYGGGGGIPIVSDVVDAVGGAVDAVGDVVGGAGDLVGSAVNTVTNIAGDALEPAVKVGEWSMENPLEAAALAAAVYYGGPALLGEGAGAGGAAAGAADAAGGLSALDAGMGTYSTIGASEAIGGGLTGYDAAMADLAASAPAGGATYYTYDAATGALVPVSSAEEVMAANAGAANYGGSGGFGSWLTNAGKAISKFGSGSGSGSGSGGSDFGLTGMGALAGLGGLAGLMSLINADKDKYGVPGRQAYTGPMSQFKYSPSTFTPTRADPNMFRPQGSVRTVSDAMMQQQYGGMDQGYGFGGGYGMGRRNHFMGGSYGGSPFMGRGRRQGYGYGFGDQMPYGGGGYGYDQPYFFAEGGETSKKPKLTPKAKLAAMDPWTRAQAELGNAAYRAQLPTATATMPPPQPLGQLNMAGGGISDLGGYSDGGRMLKGPGDGMSDSIPARIGGKREARLADGEFVVPADVVSHLGNGSTDAGAKQLYKMMDRVRAARTGHKRQGKQINADKFTPK